MLETSIYQPKLKEHLFNITQDVLADAFFMKSTCKQLRHGAGFLPPWHFVSLAL